MIRLISVWGIGDTYLAASLYHSFVGHHKFEAQLVVRSNHSAIVDLFPGVQYVVDDEVAEATNHNHELAITYENIISDGRDFYVHPGFPGTRLDLTPLTTRSFFSQADMYRLVMALPLDAEMQVPTVPSPIEEDDVILVEANSWPNLYPGFYDRLINALSASGRRVWVNDRQLPMETLLARCAGAQWVIGAQCGLMSTLIAGRFPCRKTLVSSSIDGRGKDVGYWSNSTYPYSNPKAFTGLDFDVEEFKIDEKNQDSLIDIICNGVNALSIRDHNPNPVTTIDVPMSPGDFLDRLIVLQVKNKNFSGSRNALIQRELYRLSEIYGQQFNGRTDLNDLFVKLFDLHDDCFRLLQEIVPDVTSGGGMGKDVHEKAIRINKLRVELKSQIDDLVGSAYSEVKSYYGTI